MPAEADLGWRPHRFVVRFVGEPADTEAEWRQVDSLVAYLASRLDQLGVSRSRSLSWAADASSSMLSLERLPVDETSDLSALPGLIASESDVVWIVVLGEAYGIAASVAQLSVVATGLSDAPSPSVLDLVLKVLVSSPEASKRVRAYERESPPGAPPRDDRLVLLAARLRELGSIRKIAGHTAYQDPSRFPLGEGTDAKRFSVRCAEDIVESMRASGLIDEQIAYDCLHILLPVSYVEIPLRPEGNQFAAEVSEKLFTQGKAFILGLRDSRGDLRRRIDSLAKVTSLRDMRQILNFASHGVPLRFCNIPPAEMPRHTGYIYYTVDTHDPHWSRVKDEGIFAFFLPDAEPDLEARLYVVIGAHKGKTTPGRTIPVLDENVQFTVYRPETIEPERWYPLVAFAHLAERRPDADPGTSDPLEEVERQAEQRLGEATDDYRHTTDDSSQAIPREGELTFLPEVAGIEFNPPRRTFRWMEDVHCEEFRLKASRTLDGTTARGRLTAFLGTIIVADVPLAIAVRSGTTRTPVRDKPDVSHARPYRRIFPSYAHLDLEIVRQCETYAATLGDRYLRDTVTLRSGESWNERLMELIAEADVFQLFWSRNSMRSRYVRQEWEHALGLQAKDSKDRYFVRPVYWEEPLPADEASDLPPAALRKIHFQRLTGMTGPPAWEEAAPRSGPPPTPVPAGQEERPAAADRDGLTTPKSSRPQPSHDRLRRVRPPRVSIQYRPHRRLSTRLLVIAGILLAGIAVVLLRLLRLL